MQDGDLPISAGLGNLFGLAHCRQLQLPLLAVTTIQAGEPDSKEITSRNSLPIVNVTSPVRFSLKRSKEDFKLELLLAVTCRSNWGRNETDSAYYNKHHAATTF